MLEQSISQAIQAERDMLKHLCRKMLEETIDRAADNPEAPEQARLLNLTKVRRGLQQYEWVLRSTFVDISTETLEKELSL